MAALRHWRRLCGTPASRAPFAHSPRGHRLGSEAGEPTGSLRGRNVLAATYARARETIADAQQRGR